MKSMISFPRQSTSTQLGKDEAYKMKPTTPVRMRINRFLTDRYAYRDRANYLPELLVFGLVVIAAIWPILALATTLATVR
jgi:hypothetical protein